MRRSAAWLAGAAVVAAAGYAFAQTYFPTQVGPTAPGFAVMCVDPSQVARPCDGLTPLQVAIASGYSVPPYPTGSRPVVGVSTGSTSAVTASIAAAQGRITYICGFDVSAIGGTATVGPITITNVNGSTLTYQLASTASGNFLSRTFTPCLPGSGQNTAISVATTADGTASAVDVNVYGFQL